MTDWAERMTFFAVGMTFFAVGMTFLAVGMTFLAEKIPVFTASTEKSALFLSHPALFTPDFAKFASIC